MALTTTFRRRGAICAAVLLLLAFSAPAGAQNVIVNGDFSAGEEGWNVTDIGGDFFAEVEFTDEEALCPTGGTPGGCAVVLGSTGANITVVWQEITLVAGEQYDVDGRFRMLTPEQADYWFEYHITPISPQPGTDWIGNNWEEMPFGFASWRGCGSTYDGLFSDSVCVSQLDLPFTVPGAPGEEITYYVGVKGGTGSSDDFAWSIDDMSVTLVGGTSVEGKETPGQFSIDAVYPNPFNPSATAVVTLKHAGTYTVRLYDVLGRIVQEREIAGVPGRMEIPFELSAGSSGSYVVWVRHQETGFVATTTAMLVK